MYTDKKYNIDKGYARTHIFTTSLLKSGGNSFYFILVPYFSQQLDTKKAALKYGRHSEKEAKSFL